MSPFQTPWCSSLLCLALVGAWSLAACGGEPRDAPQSASAASSAPGEPAKSGASAAIASASMPTTPSPRTLVGSWASSSCGERKYERQIRFEADGRFAALELISPCPEGARCVWSGIVQRLGSYEQKGARVALVVDAPVDEQGQPLPASMEFDSKLVERASDGSACEYAYRP